MESSINDLEQSAQELGQQIYKNQNANSGSTGDYRGTAPSNRPEDDVIDVEYDIDNN